MRLLIFGGTGPSGVLLIREALEVLPSSSLIVYVRNPNKLPHDIASHKSVTVVQGELYDTDKIAGTLPGVDAILTALGPPSNSPHPATLPLTHFYEALFPLMRQHGVKRVIALGTASIVDPHDRFSFPFWLLVWVVKVAYRAAWADLVAMGKVFKAVDDIEWTIVRVPALNDGEKKDVVAGYIGDGKTGMTLARKGFAAFVVEELVNPKWIKTCVAISSK